MSGKVVSSLSRLCVPLLFLSYVTLACHFLPLCASKVWGICTMCNASNGSDVLARAVLEAGAVNRRDARGELVGHQGSVSNCVRTFKSSILQRVPPLQCSSPPFSTHHRPTLWGRNLANQALGCHARAGKWQQQLTYIGFFSRYTTAIF